MQSGENRQGCQIVRVVVHVEDISLHDDESNRRILVTYKLRMKCYCVMCVRVNASIFFCVLYG